MKKLLFGFSLFAIAGCVASSELVSTTTPSSSVMRAAQNAVVSVLRDPSSAQFRGTPVAYQFEDGNTVVCGEVNAKNGMGGFTGFQPYYTRFNNGQVVVVKLDDTGAQGCRGARNGNLNFQIGW